jgi:hypothetical protein
VTVAAGSTSATFTVRTGSFSNNQRALVTATLNNVSQSTTIHMEAGSE